MLEALARPPALFSVVIPARNARETLRRCIAAVDTAAKRAGILYDVTVVDNGSVDGTPELIRAEYGPRIVLLSAPGATVAAARNAGAGLGNGTYISFLDADCIVSPEYYTHALAVFADARVSATGSQVSLPTPSHWIEDTWHGLHVRRSDGPVMYLNSGNFLIRRSVFESIGGFDEFLVTGEDAELGQRLTRSGYCVFSARKVSAAHLGNPKSMRAFFRRETWHGLGMLGTASWRHLDKPLAMTLLFVGLHLGAGVAIVLGRVTTWPDAAFLTFCLLLVPLVSVLYRIRILGRAHRPIAATLLYYVYFAGRANALRILGFGRASKYRSA